MTFNEFVTMDEHMLMVISFSDFRKIIPKLKEVYPEKEIDKLYEDTIYRCGATKFLLANPSIYKDDGILHMDECAVVFTDRISYNNVEFEKRNICFNKEWNKQTIRNIVKNHCYLKFGKHEDLKALLIVPFDEDDTFYESTDYKELTFIVPSNWLKETVKKEFYVEDVDYWLQNEYTSDESIIIFERALNERQIVVVDFD